MKRGANVEAHHLARWTASLIDSGGHPDIHEHYHDLVWIYAGIDLLISFLAFVFGFE